MRSPWLLLGNPGKEEQEGAGWGPWGPQLCHAQATALHGGVAVLTPRGGNPDSLSMEEGAGPQNEGSRGLRTKEGHPGGKTRDDRFGGWGRSLGSQLGLGGKGWFLGVKGDCGCGAREKLRACQGQGRAGFVPRSWAGAGGKIWLGPGVGALGGGPRC